MSPSPIAAALLAVPQREGVAHAQVDAHRHRPPGVRAVVVQTALELQPQPHLGEQIAGAHAHDVRADSRRQSVIESGTERRVSHAHLHLGLRRDGDLASRVGDQLPLRIVERGTVDVQVARQQEAVIVQLAQAAQQDRRRRRSGVRGTADPEFTHLPDLRRGVGERHDAEVAVQDRHPGSRIVGGEHLTAQLRHVRQTVTVAVEGGRGVLVGLHPVGVDRADPGRTQRFDVGAGVLGADMIPPYGTDRLESPRPPARSLPLQIGTIPRVIVLVSRLHSFHIGVIDEAMSFHERKNSPAPDGGAGEFF